MRLSRIIHKPIKELDNYLVKLIKSLRNPPCNKTLAMQRPIEYLQIQISTITFSRAYCKEDKLKDSKTT